MFYIRHNSDNFTIIDCNLADRAGGILAELKTQSADKGITRFISTHPDQDHLSGLVELDDVLPIRNFYCVANSATKDVPTGDFDRYCDLRDSSKAFNIYRGVSRKWMNTEGDGRGSAGINILWPALGDPDFARALADAEAGLSPNNMSCMIKYAMHGGGTFLWMGDLETEFMEAIEDKVDIPKVDVLFAPHHGRQTGKVPHEWLKKLNPQMIVIGEAPSEYLHYYEGYNTITQNSCGDLLFDVVTGKVHVYVEQFAYELDYLVDDGLDRKDGLYYKGSLYTS
jgi:beta-lactamase superfamily II metal-dependent hydrolase